jgi:murein DD-endopeptidase
VRLLKYLFVIPMVLSVEPALDAQDEGDAKTQFKLAFPLDCTLGKDCWVARYGDRKKGKGKADYMCGKRTQNKHRGTDFVINDYGQMHDGVSILAALNGTVFKIRTNVPDRAVTKETYTETNKIGCGNAVVLKHANGYQTSYCHMQNGSISLSVGDRVNKGEKIGSVGLSGLTEYPHLHFELRKDGTSMDPFDGQRRMIACSSEPKSQLWENDIPYKALTLMPLLFTNKPVNKQSRWQSQPKTISSDAEALVLTGRAWNVLAGDSWLFQLIRPDGVKATNRSLKAKKNRQSQWYSNILKKPESGFMPGLWRGKLLVIRQHEDGTVDTFKQDSSVLVEAPAR